MTWYDAPAQCPRCSTPPVQSWGEVSCLACGWQFHPERLDPREARREVEGAKRQSPTKKVQR